MMFVEFSMAQQEEFEGTEVQLRKLPREVELGLPLEVQLVRQFYFEKLALRGMGGKNNEK